MGGPEIKFNWKGRRYNVIQFGGEGGAFMNNLIYGGGVRINSIEGVANLIGVLKG